MSERLRFRSLKMIIPGAALAFTVNSAPLTATAQTAPAGAVPNSGGYVAAWGASPTAGGIFPGSPCPSETGVTNATIRDIIAPSTAGDAVQVRLTNTFGAQPLQVGHASIGVTTSGGAVDPATLHGLTFGGQQAITIPAGAEALSDPVPLTVSPLQDLAVSIFLPGPTGPATQHNDAQQTSYESGAGDAALATDASAYPTKLSCWLFVDGLDIHASPQVRGTVVALGDSITDGYLSTVNANRRWPDDLARRLNALTGPTLAVVNEGISGNEVLANRTPVQFGVGALNRIDRDVFSQPGARDVIYLEGINDIGAEKATAAQLIAADQQIIAQAHEHGLRIFGGTLPPFGGSNKQYGGDYGTAAGEAQRVALNQWIRTSGAFDGVIDFDAATRDPAQPDRMLPAYDSGDHLHPGDAGYQAMADAINLKDLLRTPVNIVVTGTASSPAFVVSFFSLGAGQGEVLFGTGPGCTGLVETATQDVGGGSTSHLVVVRGNDLPGTVGDNGIVPGVTYWYETVTVTSSGQEIDNNGGNCYSVTIPGM